MLENLVLILVPTAVYFFVRTNPARVGITASVKLQYTGSHLSAEASVLRGQISYFFNPKLMFLAILKIGNKYVGYNQSIMN